MSKFNTKIKMNSTALVETITYTSEDGLFLSPMDRIDLHALRQADIAPLLKILQKFLQRNGYSVITQNIFMKPEHVAQRWGLSISCLNNWRYVGDGPIYMKTGPGPKAQVRYPLLGHGGILDFEQKCGFISRGDEQQGALHSLQPEAV